ncbi:MAG: c-type cytochrome biogenesis protein CcsB [Acidimicrobiia bacterium]|nr:c-type cytochrome biogenesis protein CcsB [Acidimicrobiia bacterium]
MSATTLSKVMLLVAWFAYAGAATAALMTALTKGERWLRATFWCAVAGLTCHTIGLVAITVGHGRAPWGTLYEWVVSVSAVIVLIALVLIVRRAEFAALTAIVYGVVVVLMLAGASQYREPGALQPALQSNWLTFHVALALTGSALLLFGGVVSALYLVRVRWENRYLTSVLGTTGTEPPDLAAGDEVVPLRETDDREGDALAGSGGGAVALAAPRVEVEADTEPVPVGTTRRGLGGRLPTSFALDDLARKSFTLAFPIYTLAILAGAVWGEQAWGRYWRWDPKETTSFIIWGLFAAYLHARATRGWKGTGAAWLGVIGAVAVVFNSFFVNLVIAGLHSYAGG